MELSMYLMLYSSLLLAQDPDSNDPAPEEQSEEQSDPPSQEENLEGIEIPEQERSGVIHIKNDLLERIDIETQTEFTLIFSGIDPHAPMVRTTAASKLKPKQITPKHFSDLTIGRIPILSQGTIISCESGPITMNRFDMLVQKGNNAMLYIEYERAYEYLSQAMSELPCLKDILEVNTVVRAHYLMGIVQFERGEADLSINHFKSAFSLKPNLQWDNDFAPDAKPIFDDAKRKTTLSDEIDLTIYPQLMTKNLYINGVPLGSSKAGRLNAGVNILQVFAEDIDTYLLLTPASSKSIELIVPAGVSDDLSAWVVDNEQRKELDIILPAFFAEDSAVFFHHDSQVWKTTIGLKEWEKLDVPRFTQGTAWFSKSKISRSLLWSGIPVTLLCGSISAVQYFRASQYARDAQTTSDFPVFDNSRSGYESIQTSYPYWGAGALIGLSFTGTGIILKITD